MELDFGGGAFSRWAAGGGPGSTGARTSGGSSGGGSNGGDAGGKQRFSVKAEFAGATVLLTGCTGYIGGLILESLLRTTDVGRVYVLLRPKRGAAAQARCDQLLQGPTFHLVRDKPHLLAKVRAVAGDLSEPGLGLSAADAATLADSVDILLHSAADIRLEAPIQETMRANYVGTSRVLELALQLKRLRSMVHVSTAYVNINHAPGTTVREAVYPLLHGGVEADGELVAEELLALPQSDADRRADFYTRHWGFPNTYCLGKHLAEQLVYRTQKATGLPVAILRPSLVAGVAGLPRPGYCGNWAGPSGMGAAVAIGFFPALSAHAVRPYSVWDVVPGDMVASSILATAAAVSAGVAADIARATGSGAWLGPTQGGAPAAAAVHVSPGAAALAGPRCNGNGAGAAAGGGKRAATPAGHHHARAGSAAFTDDSALCVSGGATPSGFGSPGRSPGGSGSGSEPADLSPKALSGVSEEGGGGASADEQQQQQQRQDSGGEAAVGPASAAQQRRGPTPPRGAQRQQQQQQQAPQPQPQPLLIVHCTTSTTYPATVYESYNTTADFLRTHGCKTTILVGGMRSLPSMPPTWQPSPRMVEFWKVYNWVKVVVVCFLLRLFGLHKAAHKLSIGYTQWAMNNDFKNDTRLMFASAALRQLHARIEPSERRDYLLTFGPPRGGTANGGTAEDDEPEHPAAHLGWRQYTINCLAGIMRMVTGEVVPAEAPLYGRPGEVVRHAYEHIR